jgi:hypothetical protein
LYKSHGYFFVEFVVSLKITASNILIYQQIPKKEDKDKDSKDTKTKPADGDDEQESSPKMIYLRCGKCRTYWPVMEIGNHTCVVPSYKRVAYDPAVSSF